MRRVLLILLSLVLCPHILQAESPAPSVHWGGLAYPDQSQTLELGGTFNRFTQLGYNRDGYFSVYNRMQDTMGFNQATLSWTRHHDRLFGLEGISTNLTVGAGPTGNQPTEWIQNKAIHSTFDYPAIRYNRLRSATDVMVDASVTKWMPLVAPRVAYIGTGLSGGSLYQEWFLRAGLRRLPLAAGGWANHLRLSGMVRYARVATGAAFHDLTPNAFVAQGSLAWGIYDAEQRPEFEVEVGVTNDTGFFRDVAGRAVSQQFGLFAIRWAGVTFEMWNDSWFPARFGRPDFGPTGGGKLTLDLCRYGRTADTLLGFLHNLCA